jgi:hypothetical protein
MAEQIHFLNFRISVELKERLDEAAKLSGWDRSKQARYMLERLFKIEPKPYFPMPGSEPLGFGEPTPNASRLKSHRRRQP